MTYFSCVHSVLSYGLIFWRNSSHSEYIFRIHKRTVRVIMGSGRRDSCCQLFRHLYLLPLYSQYIFSLLLFIIKNRHQFLSNSEVTGYNSNLHLPLAEHYIRKEFFMQELRFIITCHPLSKTYQMMGNGLKQLSGISFGQFVLYLGGIF
jgi:hypothetical protein